MRKKKFILIIFIPILIITFYSIYKNYFDIIKPIEVPESMEFKIDFEHPIIFDDTTRENIIVEDNNKNPVDVYIFLSSDKKSILINPPIGGFSVDKKYSITISPKIHFKDYELKTKKYIPFTVTKDILHPPVKSKKKAEYGDIVGISDEFMGYKYDHYGIYIGNNNVIHYISTTGKVEDAKIQETSMSPYFKDGKFFVLDLRDSSKLTVEESVKRAKERIGEKSYDLLQNNCEHFVFWCKTNSSKSYQIDSLSTQQLSQLRILISMGVNLQY